MNTRRFIFMIFIATLALVLLYNFIIAPLLFFYQGNTHMHMKMGMYNNGLGGFNQNVLILVILLAVVSAVVYFLFGTANQGAKCSKCGASVESDRWRICPVCGTAIRDRRGDAR